MQIMQTIENYETLNGNAKNENREIMKTYEDCETTFSHVWKPWHYENFWKNSLNGHVNYRRRSMRIIGWLSNNFFWCLNPG